jgi:hypothetical protein
MVYNFNTAGFHYLTYLIISKGDIVFPFLHAIFRQIMTFIQAMNYPAAGSGVSKNCFLNLTPQAAGY